MEVLINRQVGANEGKAIIADFFRAERHDAPGVIFCHGFKGFKDWGSYNEVARIFAQRGFHFLKFNFSHNGGTSSQPIDFPDLDAFANNNFSKEQVDLEQVLAWLEKQEGLTHERIYLMGHSRGGASALIRAAEDKRIKAVCTWAGVSNIGERLTRYNLEVWAKEGRVMIKNGRTKQDMPLNYQLYEDFLKNEHRFDIERQVKSLGIPHLIIAAKDDVVVPMSEAHYMHQWNPSSTLIQLESGGHTFGASHPAKESALPPSLEQACAETISFFNQM